MRHIPDDVIVVERNGITFLAHPFRRYDGSTLQIGASAFGTFSEMRAIERQGKHVEKLAEQRAAIDERNAEAVLKASEEQARITAERGQRFVEAQKSQAAVGGIRINVGVPLLIEAETKAIIAKEIGFGLKAGVEEAIGLRSSAAIERQIGKAARQKAKTEAIRRGLAGLGSIASMTEESGFFNRLFTRTGRDRTSTGSSAGFGKPTHTGGRFA